jgi:hypothetical protein
MTWAVEEIAGSFKRLKRVCHPGRSAAKIRDRGQDRALISLSLRERVGVRGYRLLKRGR